MMTGSFADSNLIRRVTWLIATLTFSTLLATAQAQVDFDAINPFGEQPTAPADSADGATGEAGAEDGEPTQKTAQEVYDEAKVLMESEDWAGAIELLTQVTQAQQNFSPAHLDRGKCFIELGEDELALSSLEQAIQTGMRVPQIFSEAVGLKAGVLVDLGRYQEAVEDLELAIQSSPSDPTILFNRGKALIRVAQMEQASGFADGTASMYQQAVTSLTRCIENKEDYAEAYIERANARNALGEADKAIDDMEQAVELESDNSKYQAQLGYSYLRRADTDRRRPNADKNEVARDYQNAISSFSNYLNSEGSKDKSEFDDLEDPEFPKPDQIYVARSMAQISLANETGNKSGYEQAIMDSDRATEFNEDMVNAMFQKGVAQRLNGQLEAALDTFTEVLDLAPGQAEVHMRRGIVYFYQGEYEAARGDFQQTMELSEVPDGRAEFWTGASYAKEGRYSEAIRMYSKSIRFNPGYKPSFNNRGLAYMALGNYRRAATDFEELVRRNRKDSVARQRRDRARQLMKR